MSGWRRARLGLATLFGRRPGGFFIPYRYAGQLPRGGFRGRFPAIEELFARHEGEFAAWFDRLDAFAEQLTALGRDRPPGPRWAQMWFPRLDAAMAYTMVRTLAPARVVEVGSGHSTRFIARAIADAGLATAHACIDPAPRATLDGLRITRHMTTLQGAGLAPFADLAAGDILFVDSSHILMPGTDVDVLLAQILPSLPAGVVVHFHDIFLPDDYPVAWEWRGYNEQQGIAAMLHGGGWDLLFASRYAITRMPQRLAASVAVRLPFLPGSFEASLWLRKR